MKNLEKPKERTTMRIPIILPHEMLHYLAEALGWFYLTFNMKGYHLMMSLNIISFVVVTAVFAVVVFVVVAATVVVVVAAVTVVVVFVAATG